VGIPIETGRLTYSTEQDRTEAPEKNACKGRQHRSSLLGSVVSKKKMMKANSGYEKEACRGSSSVGRREGGLSQGLVGRLWPPVHPLVALYYFLDAFASEFIVFVSTSCQSCSSVSCFGNLREASLFFEQTTIETEIRISQQLLLHERTQRRRLTDASCCLQLCPRIQCFIVDLVDNMVEVQPGEGRYQRAVEAGFNAEDFFDNLGGVSLSCGAWRLARAKTCLR
jgi:hypothetical protein